MADETFISQNRGAFQCGEIFLKPDGYNVSLFLDSGAPGLYYTYIIRFGAVIWITVFTPLYRE